jgi:hypothetical protein
MSFCWRCRFAIVSTLLVLLGFGWVSVMADTPSFSLEETSTFARRDPLFAAAASALLPGAGQFYNGETGKGLLVAASEVVGTAFAVQTIMSHESLDVRRDGRLLLLPVAYGASIVDAARRAAAYNQRRVAMGQEGQDLLARQPRIVLSLQGAGMSGQELGMLAEVELFLLSGLGVVAAKSIIAGPDDVVVGALRWYPHPGRASQFFVAAEVGYQSGRSGYDYTLCWNGASTGLAFSWPDSPWRWTAAISAGRVQGVAGYIYQGSYVKWSSGLGMRF